MSKALQGFLGKLNLLKANATIEGWKTVFLTDVIAQGGDRLSISPFYYSLGMRTGYVRLDVVLLLANILYRR